MPLTQLLQILRCTNRPSTSDLPRSLLTTRTNANHTAKQGTGRLWSAPKGTTIVLVEESTDAELEEAEYLIRLAGTARIESAASGTGAWCSTCQH